MQYMATFGPLLLRAFQDGTGRCVAEVLGLGNFRSVECPNIEAAKAQSVEEAREVLAKRKLPDPADPEWTLMGPLGETTVKLPDMG